MNLFCKLFFRCFVFVLGINLIPDISYANPYENDWGSDSVILKRFAEADNKMKVLQDQNKQEAAFDVIQEFKIKGCADSSQLFYESVLDINYYVSLNQYDNAIASCKKALSYTREYAYNTQVGIVKNRYARLLLNKRKTDDALPLIKEALLLAENAKDNLQIATSWDVYALYYLKLSDSKNYVNCLMKALDITHTVPSGEEKDKLLISICNSLSRQYGVLGYSDKALEYGQLAYQLAKVSHDQKNLIRSCQIINYNKLLTYDQRINYCKEGIEAANNSGWHEFTETFYYLVSAYFYKLNNNDSSKFYYLKAKDLHYKVEGSGAKNDLENSKFDATVYNEPDSAFSLLQQYERNTAEEQKKSLNWKKRFYYRKSIYFAAVGKYDSAYHLYADYKAVSDSIQNKDFVEATEKLNIQYESARKENEIALLKKENEINTLTISNKDILIAKKSLENLKQRQSLLIKDLEISNNTKSLAISKGERDRKTQELLLVNKDIKEKETQLALLEQSKRNEALLAQKQLIQQENEQVKEKKNIWIGFLCSAALLGLAVLYFIQKSNQRNQRLSYEAMIKSIEQERDRISSDLHDDIGSTLSSIAIYNELISDKVKTKPELVPQLSEKISVHINELMHHTEDIIWSLKIGPHQNETISKRVQEYATELLDSKQIQSHIEIEPNVEQLLQHPEQRRNMLLIIKEAMNNCTKYSQAKNFTINMFVKQTQLILDIMDDGIGFDKDRTVFGDGIQNIQNRCKILNGHCEIKSEPGKGTSIHCELPISSYTK